MNTPSDSGKNNDVKKLLFICTGNTCRSVMAEAIAKKQLNEKYPGKFECQSAGVKLDIPRSVATKEGVIAVNSQGYGHIPEDRIPVSYKEIDFESFDKVYVLSAKRLKPLVEEFPHMKEKIKLYTNGSVPDPYDLEHFPPDWPNSEHPDNRTQAERQESYNYTAKKINDQFTPQLIKQLEKEFISPELSSTGRG